MITRFYRWIRTDEQAGRIDPGMAYLAELLVPVLVLCVGYEVGCLVLEMLG